MPLITTDKIEISIEKQPETSDCKWFVRIRVENKMNTKSILFIKTNEAPFINFMKNKNNMIYKSKSVQNEIVKKK